MKSAVSYFYNINKNRFLKIKFNKEATVKNLNKGRSGPRRTVRTQVI